MSGLDEFGIISDTFMKFFEKSETAVNRNPLFDKLAATSKELVEQIRELSRSQRSLWQQIPFLAVLADGRTGFLDHYSRAYYQGYWAIRASVRDGCFTVYVDLETGELVCSLNPGIKASDNDLLMIASALDQIDAAAIIEELSTKAKQPIGRFYDPAKQECWRRGIVQERGLKPDTYERKTSVQKISE